MKAPATLIPLQTSAPSQKRQIGARRKTRCQASPRSSRLADNPPCSQGSNTPRNARGAETATKSRLAGSFPYKPHDMSLDPGWAAELAPRLGRQRVDDRTHVDLVGNLAPPN